MLTVEGKVVAQDRLLLPLFKEMRWPRANVQVTCRDGKATFTSKTFACGSCHPNGNIDQLQWTINATVAPGEGPAPDGQLAEPRTTQPIRGLRDTVPLHWEGVLADPFPGVNPEAADFDSAPDCDIDSAKRRGTKVCLNPVLMDFSYRSDVELDAYEWVLLDCILGDQMLFLRQEGVEHTWRLLTPVLEHIEKTTNSDDLPLYAAGSSGPAEAERS